MAAIFEAMKFLVTDAPRDLYLAGLLVVAALVLDVLDGEVARRRHSASALGRELDSLADVISFGVAPALLVYKWVLYRFPVPGLIVSFLYVACAAVRLARFNVLASNSSGAPVKPGKFIIGLPTPPACGILVSLVVANHAAGGLIGRSEYTMVLLFVTIGLSLLMVSNVHFRSFKELRLDTGTVVFVLFVIASSAFVWQRFRPEFVLVWLLSVYLVIGILETLREFLTKLFKRERESLPPG